MNKLSFAKAALLLLIVNALLYSNSFKHPFMIDDGILFQPSMQTMKFLPYHLIPDSKKFLNIGQKNVDVYYRPIAHTMFLLEHVAFKKNTFGYHVTSFILFWISAFLLFLFLHAIFRDEFLALLASLFYCIHPINNFLVNYITASYFSMQTIFIILSLWMLWIAQTNQRPFRFYFLSIITFILALFCHESSMTYIFYAFALLYFGQKLTIRNTTKKIAPLLVTLGVYFIFRLNFSSFNKGVLCHYQDFNINFLQYLASLTKLIVWYIQKLFIPYGVVLTWGTPVVKEYVWGWIVLFFLLLSAVIIIIHYKRNAAPSTIGLSWLLAGLLPLSGACLIQPPRGFLIEPFWLIFASIGFFIFLADLIKQIWQNKNSGKIKIIVIAIILSWSFLTFKANALWDSEKGYCLNWLKEAPNFSPVFCHLARVYTGEKNYNKARYYHLGCLTTDPGDQFNYYFQIGMLDLRQEKWENAQQNLLKAYSIFPNESNVLGNLGALAFKNGQVSEAKTYFLKAIESDRFSILPRINMASIYTNEGKTEEAIQLYQEIISLGPDNPFGYIALLRIYWNKNDKENALKTAQKVLKLTQDAESLINIGLIYSNYLMHKEAIQCFSQAIKIKPNSKEAYLGLAEIYAKENDHVSSSKILKTALQVFPDDKEILKRLSQTSQQPTH